jgi:hypothetical protein
MTRRVLNAERQSERLNVCAMRQERPLASTTREDRMRRQLSSTQYGAQLFLAVTVIRPIFRF